MKLCIYKITCILTDFLPKYPSSLKLVVLKHFPGPPGALAPLAVPIPILLTSGGLCLLDKDEWVRILDHVCFVGVQVVISYNILTFSL